jgi:prepilin-type N-terminal cleavage/methylation domain-containing protein
MNTVRSSFRRAAFTLIELMVVIGVIGLIAGIGIAVFGGRNTGTSLASSQLVSVSLLNSVRAQAAATGRNARLLVAADTSAAAEGEYLRRIFVAYQEVTNQTTGATVWRITDAGTALPAGIYVVPEGLAATQMATGVSTFGSNLQSNFSGSATLAQTFPGVASANFWYIELTP